MTLDTAAVMTQTRTLVDTLGVNQSYTGIPESFEGRLVAFVTLGGQSVVPRTTSSIRRTARYWITFGYAVDLAEASAEIAIAAALDALIRAVYTDRTLGGTCASVELDLSPSDAPEYREFASDEARLYPVVLIAIQDETINPYP